MLAATAALLEESVEGGEHGTRALQEPPAGGAETSAVAVALKQRGAQVLLHPEDLLGERRLAEVEEAGGAAVV